MRKKILATTTLLLALSLFSVGNYDTYNFSQPVAFAASEVANQNNDSAKKEKPKTVVEFSNGNYKLINDKTETLSEQEMKEITEELNLLYEKGAKHNDSSFKLFTFIYDSPAKGIKDAETEVLSNNNLSSNVEPIIFIFNKANKEYKYIIDERIQTFVSLPYLQEVTNKTIVEQGLNKASLEELLIRINSVVEMSISGELNTQNKAGEKYDKNKFSIRNITKDTNVSSSQEDKKDTSSKKTNTKQDDANDGLYSGIAILLAFVSIFVVFYKKKKNNNATRK